MSREPRGDLPGHTAAEAAAPILRVEDLHVSFVQRRSTIRAVRGISYSIAPGEALGIVGESGAGKSVSAMALLGLLPPTTARVQAGSVQFEGREIGVGNERALRGIRGSKISVVFQDPLSALNPVVRIGTQITEQIQTHTDMSRSEARDRAIALLGRVGIPHPASRIRAYPHEFSGGMRQRAMIAMALACDPSLVIADEPTTALDVTIQSQILELLSDLRRDLGMSLLLITHDLGVIANATDRVAVMYSGHIVEMGPTKDVLKSPAHPYTRGLLRSMPRLDRPRTDALAPIGGHPPDLTADLSGCPFRPRCAFAVDQCAEDNPTLTKRGPGHRAACWHEDLTQVSVGARA